MIYIVVVGVLLLLMFIECIDLSGCDHEFIITGCGYTVCKKCKKMF
jgi:hypothetical protein